MKPFNPNPEPTSYSEQKGGGLLTVVTAAAVVFALVQGSVYYKANASAKFVSGEKSKVVALQVAESGIETNISAIGNKSLKITANMNNYQTYSGKAIGSGNFSSSLTTKSVSPSADTVDITSTGTMNNKSQTINARLKIRKYLDTAITTSLLTAWDTTYTYSTKTVMDTTITNTIKDPNTMPDLNVTPAYIACFASAAKKCDVCHLPGGDATKSNVISISKSAINTHISHHGDYVTTDGTCDMYKAVVTKTIASVSKTDTTRIIKLDTTFVTAKVIDTAYKTQVLSWK